MSTGAKAGSSPGLGPVRNDKNDKGVNGRGAYFLPVLSSGVLFGEDELADEELGDEEIEDELADEDLGDEELAPAAIAEGGSEAL